jgi:hypothetical protein
MILTRFVRIRSILIRIRRIRMYLGLLDPDPLVRGMEVRGMDSDPDPSITIQK